jgi:hypothetical protein
MSEGFARIDGELDAVRKRVDALETLLPSAVLDLIQGDPHNWSNRPCPTCQPITTMIGRPFGCYRYQVEQKRKS